MKPKHLHIWLSALIAMILICTLSMAAPPLLIDFADCLFQLHNTNNQTYFVDKLDLKLTALSISVDLLILVTSAIGLFFIWKSLRDQRISLEASVKPFVTISFEPPKNPAVSNKGFVDAEGNKEEVWIRIHNAGNSPATVKKIARCWRVCPRGKTPDPIEYGSECKDVSIKRNEFPIGGNSYSDYVRTQAKYRDVWPEHPGETLFFMGYIIFESTDRRTYISGYCYTFLDGKFHLAWPEESDKPDLYNYHREIF